MVSNESTWLTLDSGDTCFIKMSERMRTLFNSDELFNLVVFIISDYGKFSLYDRNVVIELAVISSFTI